MIKLFSRRKQKEIPEPTKIEIEGVPKNYRYKCVRCGLKYGQWGDDEVVLYKIVKPEFETPPPKDAVCPLCHTIGKITSEIYRIEEDLDQRKYLASIKGEYTSISKEIDELKSKNRGLKEELNRLKRYLPGGDLA
jgi:hypothetical protein